ncbi:MAG TPA: phage shock protein operon transcriptional activator [Arenibaculum sp.]|nr:phage shock protein operon transcriptional activator [Arenibaculum sp.]
MLEQVSRLAPLDKPVLVIGERGTGKELVAARIHYLSRRWEAAFVKVNCAALSETLLESELFGHEAGAFTGAIKRRPGRFELADGGSLFLDEIATASDRVQEKLLRVVEYGEFERLGGTATVTTDVRVIGATNTDLPALAAEGRFRPDLLDRLAFDVVTIPPLRARREDIPLLADHYAMAMARELGWEWFPGFTEDIVERLSAHDWPGNVRELRNTVERAVYRSERPDRPVDRIVLDPFLSPWRPPRRPAREKAAAEEMPEEMPEEIPEEAGGFEDRVRAFEAGLLRSALERNRFNQKQAAADIGLGYHQFRRHLRRHGLLAAR